MPSPLKQPCNSNFESGEQLFYRWLFSSRLGAEQPACQLCFTLSVLLRCCWVSSTKTLQWTWLAFHASLDLGQLAQRSLGVVRAQLWTGVCAESFPQQLWSCGREAVGYVPHFQANDALRSYWQTQDKIRLILSFPLSVAVNRVNKRPVEKFKMKPTKKRQKKPERVPKKTLALCFNHLGGSRLVFGVRGVRVLPWLVWFFSGISASKYVDFSDEKIWDFDMHSISPSGGIEHVLPLLLFEQWSKNPGCFLLRGIVLPNDMGILISQCKDPYQPTTTWNVIRVLNTAHVLPSLNRFLKVGWWFP